MNQTNQHDSEDESAIRTVVAEYTSAWNKHDARAMTRFFAEDADFIGGSGGRVNRDAFTKTMAEEHATVFKDHRLATTVEQIRFLKTNIAIVDGSYEAADMTTPDSKPFTGLFTLVMRKTGGKWLGVAMRSISQ